MKSVINTKNSPLRPNYTQVKVSVVSDVAIAFKAACAAANVSMAAELSRFMVDYTNVRVKSSDSPDYSTRRRRRAAIKNIILQLEQMKSREESVRDNMPENLQNSCSYDATEEAVSLLEEAIEILADF